LKDNDILDLFFQRQEEALEETKKKYGKRLYHSALNILHSNEDAEECVQDTLFKAWEAIPPARPTMLGAFLAKIARNLAINKWKASTAERRGGGEVGQLLSELEDSIPSTKLGVPEDEYDSGFVVQAINECLNSMNQTMRVIFVLRYFYGESISDICKRSNMSESKVKSLLFRARKKLKTHLEKEGVVI
jgi:RNA polymerase sigma-70 factor (ECF subfamily)